MAFQDDSVQAHFGGLQGIFFFFFTLKKGAQYGHLYLVDEQSHTVLFQMTLDISSLSSKYGY